MAKRTTAQRFWAKVDKDGPIPKHNPGLGPCWLWTGTKFRNGYGLFLVSAAHGREQRAMAHRYAYEHVIGPIPTGLDLDHVCHNTDPDCAGGWTCLHRLCVNPTHSRPATRRENLLAGVGSTIPNQHATKTHCPAGHPYDEANTYLYRGQRHCRTCRRQHNADYLERNRAERTAYLREYRKRR